ncbi:MAG: MmcQ/YjbR family DNA-binding protein [Ignavibacteria bacterium]|nr:MmcQ/YjbR family DNA-binding protein [Ignavibacteria bacterium]
MIKTETFRELALSLPNSYEEPYFDKTSFRINKKIFATLNEENSIVTIKLNPIDQNVFSSVNPDKIYPVPNKWGKLGWTHINLKKVRKNTLLDALTTSYFCIANQNTQITKNKY